MLTAQRHLHRSRWPTEKPDDRSDETGMGRHHNAAAGNPFTPIVSAEIGFFLNCGVNGEVEASWQMEKKGAWQCSKQAKSAISSPVLLCFHELLAA